MSFIFIFAGLFLFLFSLGLLKKQLNSLFSTKLSNIIQSLTNSRLKSFMFGCFAAAAIQSSSGVTAIAIAFFVSNYIKPNSCLGIIIGANLGTCITTFITAININHISLFLIILGFIAYISFTKFNKYSILIIYIGIMLLGLDILNYGFAFILNNEAINNLIYHNQNSTALSTLFGVLSTAIIQSSSGIISIVEQMYCVGLINIKCAICIMLGANIGTTITGYLSTIKTSNNTKIIIDLNLYFNVFGVFLFIIFLIPFINLIIFLQNKYFLSNLKFSIAVAHFIFNFVTVVLAFVFFKVFEIFINNKLTRN